MSRQNLAAHGAPPNPLTGGLSREAMIIFRVLGGVGLCYAIYSGACDTGLVRWLNEWQLTVNGGFYFPKFSMASALFISLFIPVGVAHLFDRVTGRGSRSTVKK